jgi:hypothetical protein
VIIVVEDFSRALELEPAFAEAALQRGLLHFREKRLNDAAVDFQRALDNGVNPRAAISSSRWSVWPGRTRPEPSRSCNRAGASTRDSKKRRSFWGSARWCLAGSGARGE